ncbi:hypothetical protein CASFOL_011730 [Castilleja foliolosa]|uniref:MULE transposase domain-containing protein n=1 Tax=Castilleja foliolosa TaxID=1961234 RepID=A0ABD3DQR4_9LAMI
MPGEWVLALMLVSAVVQSLMVGLLRGNSVVPATPCMLWIESNDSGSWVVTKFVEDHNHSTMSPSKVHFLRPHRHFAGSTNCVLPETTINLQNNSMVSVEENQVHYDPTLLDDGNLLSNVFWADARSRIAYRHFGDAVTFDTMYRPNQFQVSFAPFTGVNNHGQMILCGCTLLLDESEASFAWVFHTWLSAMNNRPPVSPNYRPRQGHQGSCSSVVSRNSPLHLQMAYLKRRPRKVVSHILFSSFVVWTAL